jgi:hypothetical protein
MGMTGVARSKPEKAPGAFLSLPYPQGGEGEERRIPEPFHEYPRREKVHDFIPPHQHKDKKHLLRGVFCLFGRENSNREGCFAR